jgi:hypothetical protein
MSQQANDNRQAHPVRHPPVAAPTNDQGVVWIDEAPQSTWIDHGMVTTVSMVTLGSAFLFLMPIVAMPAVGATRSARLRWASRQTEIEQALAEQQAFLQSECVSEADSQSTESDRQE